MCVCVCVCAYVSVCTCTYVGDRSTLRPIATHVARRRTPTAPLPTPAALVFAVGGISATSHTAAAPTCNVYTKAVPFRLCARLRRPRAPCAASMVGRIAIRPTMVVPANAVVRFTRHRFAARPPTNRCACGHRPGAALLARTAPPLLASPTVVSRALQWVHFLCWCAVASPTVADR